MTNNNQNRDSDLHPDIVAGQTHRTNRIYDQKLKVLKVFQLLKLVFTKYQKTRQSLDLKIQSLDMELQILKFLQDQHKQNISDEDVILWKFLQVIRKISRYLFIFKLVQNKEMICLNSHDKPTLASFIKKTFKILNNQKYKSIISWDDDGKIIKIFDFQALQDRVLEAQFRHRNHHSFIRQLNMYGFKKMRRSTQSICYFIHPLFNKKGEQFLHLIKRKKQNKKCLFSEDQKQINDVKQQKNIDVEIEKIKALKRNSVLSLLGIKRQESDVSNGIQNEKLKGEEQQSNLSKNQKLKQLINSKDDLRRTSINIFESSQLKSSKGFEEFDKGNRSLETQISLKQKQGVIHSKNVVSFQLYNPNKSLSQEVCISGGKTSQEYYGQNNNIWTSNNGSLNMNTREEFNPVSSPVNSQYFSPQMGMIIPFNLVQEMNYSQVYQPSYLQSLQQFYFQQPVYYQQASHYF